MQRYTAASCGAGVSNGAVGGASTRDNARADSSFSSNFTPNLRRTSQLTPYKLKCDKETLNSRLGPPDFYPQTPHCAEETLTREYIQSGYKETVDGIEEVREIVLTQATLFTKSEIVLKCKEAIRKRFRAINESRAQKRKAGQVYGAPLSGSLLVKPGVFPEQRPCSEDFRRKWIEALSQHHKRLRSLSEQVPHGYRRKSLFEVLIRYNVPLLRATWFIKVTYLNQVRPASTSALSGALDKAQVTRTDLWTKDVIEYLQQLLDELFSKDGSFLPTTGRDQSSQILVGPALHRIDYAAASPDAEEPSLQFKWWYMLRLIQWHYAEGLLLPSPIIEWSLGQLQERTSAEALELLLPVLVDVIESLAVSQTFVRTFVDVATRSINDLSPGDSCLLENSEKTPLISALAEMMRYLILAVPDTFVSLDCFPLPLCVVPDANFESTVLKAPKSIDCANFDTQDKYLQHLSFGYFVSSLQKRASTLRKIVNPSLQGHGAAKVVQALDKTLLAGDVRFAYNCLFEDLCDAATGERWIADVSPCLRSSLKWVGSVNLSLISSVFFLCEWATCDYRDSRTTIPQNLKITGQKDFSQVYIALLLIKLRMNDMLCLPQQKNDSQPTNHISGAESLNDSFIGGAATGSISAYGNSTKEESDNKKNRMDMLQSPGPLHDIIVCWLDQHEIGKGGGFKRLQVLIMELIHSGIFYPQAYVRQLIVSGIMDRSTTPMDLERQRRHCRILKQLPGSCLFDVMDEARIAEGPALSKTVQIYSNERRLLLHGLLSGNYNHICTRDASNFSSALQKRTEHYGTSRDCTSPMLVDSRRNCNVVSIISSFKQEKLKAEIVELKALISTLLRFPQHPSVLIETRTEEPQRNRKRPLPLFSGKADFTEGTNGCEECWRAKRQKLVDEKSSSFQAFPLNQSDDEDTWWVRKGTKSQELLKNELPHKSTKNSSRGRQKNVRKTQSLAQLAAARIESSHGASTSHTCEHKVSCPHHRPGIEGEISKDPDRLKASYLSDIGKSIKQLRLLEKRSISIWLLTTVRQLVDGNEKAASKVCNSTSGLRLTGDDRHAIRWKLGEDDLSFILYILDISSDLVSAVKFLLWLLPKILAGPNSSVHVGRNVMMLSRCRENLVCFVGETFWLSCLRRYENVLVAADLLPEVLTAVMHRTVAMTTSGSRLSNSVAFAYARSLLKKYRDVASVMKWDKNFRATCDPRFLAELDAGRSVDSDLGFSSGASAGGDDFEEFFRQKMSGRMSRVGPTMKETVQRQVEEAVHHFSGKERKLSNATSAKNPLDKWDDANQIAHDIVLGLVDCIRQSGNATQEGDPSVVASAVSAIIGNVGPAVAKLPDFATSSNSQNVSSSVNSLNCVRHILHIHITSLCLLKEYLGERMSRIFEIALATEASLIISVSFSPGKSHRNQFQLSPETHDMNSMHSSDSLNSPAKMYVGRAVKAAAAVSALIIGAIVHGVSTLERMLTFLKLKEGLDVAQFIRSARSSSNGISRSFGASKLDYCVEVYVHWFRLLIGNCRTVSDGLVAEILGESYVLALSRMQRTLPLSLVLPPAYSIFAMVIWRPYIFNSNIAVREEIQLYQYLSLAIEDAIRYQPFRDLCLQSTRALYELLSSDVGDSEFASMLELHNPDKHLKTMAFVPLRARLFLNAIVDCKMPPFTLMLEDGSWVTGSSEPRVHTENVTKHLNQLVHVLDTLQPAKFHWQWVELRLLLHEQALIEKIETHNMSFVDAIRSLSPNAENFALSENERNLTEILLTRVLVRPDAAPLYSEVVHLLGRSLEESLVMDIKWILAGNDVLLGRKSIRQQLIFIAQRKGLSTKSQYWKPWGWSCTAADVASRGDKRNAEAISVEEGEVVDDCVDMKRSGKSSIHLFDSEGVSSGQQYLTERALAELLLPCIDRSSSDLRTVFASELIKQMSTIDQQINTLTRSINKHGLGISSGVDGSSNKGSSRKGIRGGSPGLGRRSAGVADPTPPSATALRASMWLRLRFLLRLLPIIYADREPSPRNMRHTLASIILRLLGSRIVYEDADLSLFTEHVISAKREADCIAEVPISIGNSTDCLFDMFLYIFHGLLSNCKPSWLKQSPSKSTAKSSRDFSVFDCEVAETLQADLDRMELPATIRRRILAAMPMLSSSLSFPISCQPPALSSAALASLQPSTLTPSPHQRILPVSRTSGNLSGRSRMLPSQDMDLEIDPWMLLEDGTGSASSSSTGNLGGVGGDSSNLKACNWLKGAVRVRRADLTYTGALDDDS